MTNQAELPGLTPENDAEMDHGTPGSRAVRAKDGRLTLWVASASSLAVGVAAAVAYGVWFNHDQRAYMEAIASARQALGIASGAPAARTTAWSGQVALSPGEGAAAQKETDGSAATLAAGPDSLADMQDPMSSRAANPNRAQSGRPFVRNRSEITARNRTRHNPFLRIVAFFHRGAYRHHGVRGRHDSVIRP
jgi:hypothetical protein